MNGQPTAQNTRETGADGDLSGMRNWANRAHILELAELWNVDEMTIPHWAPPTHAMQIFRYAEQGSIELLWISATNPAVTLPELARIREILGREELFVVVQDLFLTETARFADVVLPGATWGEKTGTFTNADRTVHLSERAVDPPGEARPDLDIFLDYARRMDFRDRDGEPLIKWHDPESAFEAWKACSKRPAVRLLRAHLRPAARRKRPSVGRRAPLHRRRLQHRPGLLRGVRARPADRRDEQRDRVPGQGAGRPCVPTRRRLRAVARDAGRRVPAAPHDGPYDLPLPHTHQDRSRAGAERRRAARVGRAEPRGRETSSGSPTGTRSSSSRRAGRSRRPRVSRTSDPAPSSSPSTTASRRPTS